ncbi:MAG: 50S ribosomal protein L24 [Parcubacteria group bacterium]|nr:50S ribosomal protein L24 [Parcubacteria group bacterium]
MKIKKGDNVKILSGKERGKTGKVIRVMPALRRQRLWRRATEAKAVVEGLNLHKKHARSRQAERKGEVVLVPGGLSLSKLALVCPQCGRATRVGYEIAGDKKNRICKKCRQMV